MAEKIKDAEDRLLESLFVSEPLADNGFSALVETKIRRRVWLRRIVLPLAVVLGGIVAFRPLSGLLKALANFSSLIPDELISATASVVPQSQIIILGALLFAVCVIGMRLLEE